MKAIHYTRLYGGMDLRDRIVGARTLSTAHSPYYYKWTPGDPEELLNPLVHQDRNISGVTAPPGTLYLLYLLSPLKYSVIRIVWLGLQYLFLGYIIFTFLRKRTTAETKCTLAFFGIVFFCCSPFWLFHVERGQVYIFYAFFFCIIYQAYKSPDPWWQFTSGLLIVAAVYCRPLFIVFALPLLFSTNRRALKGFIVGGTIALLFLFFNFQVWKDYLQAMSAFTNVTGGLSFSHAPPLNYPAVIEGMTNLEQRKSDFICGGLLPLKTYLGSVHIRIGGKAYILIYALVLTGVVYFFRKKLRQANAELFVLFGFLLYMLAEYIMPAPRAGYNLVQWIIPILLLVSTERMSVQDKILMCTGLCFMVGFPFTFPFFNDIGELLLLYTVVSFIWRYHIQEINRKQTAVQEE